MKKVFLLLSALVMTVTSAMSADMTFDFTGQGDAYGLTRYSGTVAANVDNFVKTLSCQSDGITLTCETLNPETGLGWALMSIANKENGLCAYGGYPSAKTTTPKVTLSSSGKITGIKVVLYGNQLNTTTASTPLTVTCGDTSSEITAKATGGSNEFSYDWSNSEGAESISFSWRGGTFYTRTIRSVTVTYQADMGDKQPADLSFSINEVEVLQDETFNAPELKNPHNLPITWESSNPTVASVDESGNVTLLSAGSVVITATTEGNDEYGGDNAKYTIKVIGVANNISDMLAMAPGTNQQVKVNFPMTVAYCNGSDAWVFDSEGNATAIHNDKKSDSTSTTKEDVYVVGDIIPAGWLATNQISLNNYWFGLPADSNEADRVEVIYPVVESINYAADAFKVVVLKDVTFTSSTPAGTEDVMANTPTNSYKFEDTFGVGSNPAGTYDVTLVVNYSRNGTVKWLAPINYAVPVVEEPTFPEAKDLVVAVSGEGATTYNEEENTIEVATKVSEDNAVVTLTVPEGWDNFVYLDWAGMMGEASTQAEDDVWQPVADLTQQGFVLGKEITVAADGTPHVYTLTLVKGDQAYMPASYNMQVTATKDALVPADKTVTIDFTTDNYGITGTISANKTFVTYESVVLTNGSVSKSFTKGSGFKMNQFSDFTISSIEGPVKEVKIESPTTSNPEDFTVEINEDGVATVKSWYMGQAVVSKITVVFEADGLENAGISFPAATLQLVNGKDEIKGLVLENPNNLPVTYSSSDYNVTVNENGAISLAENVKGATAIITATFAGDSKYRKDVVSYELTIVPIASSITELKELAGTSKSKAYVDFPMVVAFSNLSAAFVQSLDGTEYTYINQSGAATSYPANSIIPQGWIATATLNYGAPYYAMSEKPVSVQTQEAKIEKVDVINTDEKYKVVILKNVDITEEVIAAMPDAKTGNYTVTAGDATYTVQNQYKLPKLETPGKYDLKCVIYPYTSSSTRLFAIEYTEAVEDPEPPTPVVGTVTYDFLNEDYGLERSSSTYIESGTVITEGISSITLTKDSANGFRLWSDGLRLYKGNDTMTLAVENAQITKVTMNSKQTSLGTVSINGTSVTADNKTYTWEGDAESVSIIVTPSTTVAVESITIEYTQLAPGKDAAELSFPAAEFTVGETEAFTKGVLSNPHELPVTWTSSDEAVAMVTEEGAVVIKGLGTTTITATSAETDKYAAGSASYKLTVVAAATTIPQMLEKAPNKNDEILMNGTLYVAYANGQFVYVQDLFENSTLLYGSNSYTKGDVIPGGWVAKNAIYNGLLEWAPVVSFPEAVDNNPAYIEYPVVDELTTADVNRVVTLQNIEFTEQTPANGKGVEITLADGTKIALFNKFNLAQADAGKYDVVAAVTLYNNALQLYPIEYTEPAAELAYPEALDITCSFDGATVTNKKAGDGSLQVTVEAQNIPADDFSATIAIPEGWSGLMISNDDDDVVVTDGSVSPMMRVNTENWPTVEQMEAYGYALGNKVTVPVTKEYDATKVAYNTYNLSVLLVKDGKADYFNQIELTIKVNKASLTGVEAIDAIADGVRFFTLEGVEVTNPVKGVYVKVEDGKASKVVIR